jgi:EmrB/QacA subfamily drug resistance transporter
MNTSDPTIMTGERADLLAMLAKARHFLRYTTRDLDEEQARQRTTVSELTLGGLIKHVTAVERNWSTFIVEPGGAAGRWNRRADTPGRDSGSPSGVAPIWLYVYNEYMSTTNRRPWLILSVCCLSLLIVGTDATIVNVALPAIRRSLGTSLSGLQWSVDAYTVVIASFLMAAGSTGDRFGRRRVFQVGLALFTLGSLLCSLAWSVTALVIFRCMQALGGSMLNPVALSIISNNFTEPRARARALGVWGAVFGLSLALGPVVGGVLVSAVSWRAIFWINIPIGVAAIVLTQLFVPESKAGTARRFDPWGQALVVVTLASLTYSVIEGPSRGWGSALIITTFTVAAAAAVALVIVESHRWQPLLEVRFFRSIPLSGASLIAILAFAVLSGFLFINTLYLQEGRGYSALHAGLLTLPMAVMIVLFAPVSGRLVGSRGPRLPLVLAGCLMVLAAVGMLRLGDGTSIGYLILCYVLFGLAFGLVNAPISNTAVSGMPNSQAGVAASVASSSRQTGSALGVAVTGSIVATSADANLASASHAAWAVLAGCGAAIVAIGYVSTGKRALRSAERVRGLFAEPAAVPQHSEGHAHEDTTTGRQR